MLHVESTGDGADLVLLHGWAMHGGVFAPLTPLLARHFRVHVVDLPGHGLSRGELGDGEAVDARDWAARIAALVPPGALWVGWSLGGLIALQAALNGVSVHGLVEIAASPRLLSARGWPHGIGAQALAEFGAELQHDYRRAIERFLALELIGAGNARSTLRDLKARVFERGEPALHVLIEGLRVLETIDLRERLRELPTASLWIAGRRDRLIPASAMQWSAGQSPRGRFVEIDSGHAPFLSQPAEVADAIVAFADGLQRT